MMLGIGLVLIAGVLVRILATAEGRTVRKLPLVFLLAAAAVEAYAETTAAPGSDARMRLFWVFCALLAAAAGPSVVRFFRQNGRLSRPHGNSSK